MKAQLEESETRLRSVEAQVKETEARVQEMENAQYRSEEEWRATFLKTKDLSRLWMTRPTPSSSLCSICVHNRFQRLVSYLRIWKNFLILIKPSLPFLLFFLVMKSWGRG